MICNHLSWLWALYVVVCAVQMTSTNRGAQSFDRKVSMTLEEVSENPKCFAEARGDLTCFWEEEEETSVDKYSFTYNYEHRKEKSTECLLRLVAAAGGKSLIMCHLNRTQLFVKMDIQVHKEGILIHNRSLLVDHVVRLDPPANVTVTPPDRHDQLNVSWVPHKLKYMYDSVIYEISYAPADGHAWQVEGTKATSKVILRSLEPDTNYKVRVRVKLDGISYDGFWSAWSELVYMDTLPAALDPLVISLTLIISLILALLFLTILLYYCRFLVKKILPTIPTPDAKFQGLFTVYGGNFEEWLGQSNGDFWLALSFFNSEECTSPLEVLSEHSIRPPLPFPPLPPKASRAATTGRETTRDENNGLEKKDPGDGDALRASPHDPWLMNCLRGLHQDAIPGSESSLMESQDAYVTLSGNNHSNNEHLDEILEEALPLEVLFTSRQTASCESHSDLGSVQQSSGSGRLSSQSSFEYPNHPWMPKGPGYTYMAVADSGVSMDYSPMSRADDIGKMVIYANEYKNEIPALRRPLLARQQPVHDDVG